MNASGEAQTGSRIADQERARPGARNQSADMLRIAATFLWMALASLVMLAVGIPTLFQARRLYSEWFAKWIGRGVLEIWGVRYVVHQSAPFPSSQTVYISNHTSTLDVFILIGVGLPRARYFLSGFLRKFVPLAIIGYMIRVFWTVLQDRPAERTRIFQRADRILRRTGDSVYLSPEGERVTSGNVGPFNKGAFHLATSLQVPIVPLFIAIPADIDPGRGYAPRSGTVHVYVKPAIDTRDWRLEDLDRNRQAVREMFVRWNEELR
ncbi:MAG: lysophospholipid acyltransferase family protein [Bryobacteraceae bacterium]